MVNLVEDDQVGATVSIQLCIEFVKGIAGSESAFRKRACIRWE